jgi:hypothetical protein
MAIQSPERAAEVINVWFGRHPELVNDSHNAEVLGAWIKANHGVAGELIFTDASLEMAFRTLASSGQLHFYVSPETQAALAQATQQASVAQQALTDKKREEDRQARALFLEREKEARQAARGPGRKSAYEIDPQDAARKQRDAQDEAKKIQRAQLHAAFLAELRDANNHLETMSDGSGRVQWGKTNDARTRMKENLKRKYPAFAGELK